MANIHKDAFVTIAATTSPFFQGACSRKVTQIYVSASKRDETLDTIVMARKERTRDLPEPYPLLTCGWVHQERTLFRRYLHCHKSDLMLEYREHRVCECGNHPSSDEFYGEQLAAKFRYHRSRRTRLASTWQKVVVNYTMLHLTRPSDSLLAIYSCAMTRATRSEGKTILRLPRPAEWRAPSWSWACIDSPDGVKSLSGRIADAEGGAKASLEAFRRLIREIRCGTKHSRSTFNLDPAASYLWIDCTPAKAHVHWTCFNCRKAMSCDHKYIRRSIKPQFQDQTSPLCTFAVDKLEKRDSRFEMFQDYKYTENTLDFSVSDSGNIDPCMIAPVSLLKALDLGGGIRKGIAACFFLVMKTVDGDSSGSYERIGVASIGFSSPAKLESWLKDVLEPRFGVASTITLIS
ncbi:hypothetical protein F5Y16DRAFT_420629 [Xylariaceae sp. FL0255]|nr:hypothetical protein F5Y16DRAFT_420629 [Xylariaceae sp. FL0255]